LDSPLNPRCGISSISVYSHTPVKNRVNLFAVTLQELAAELARRVHQLAVAREAVVQEQATRGEAESGATWLAQVK